MINTANIAGARPRQPRLSRNGELSTAEAVDNFKSWQNRYGDSLGEMISPTFPTDSESHRTANQPTHQLVEQVLSELLDTRPELSAQDDFPSLAVELFSGSVPQAEGDSWVVNKQDRNQVSKLHKKRATNRKPFYLLLMSKGMLDSLNSRDELAFVVAQQLAEVEQLHTQGSGFFGQKKPRANSQSFVQSDRVNSESDLMAMNWMEKAGYNPKAALSALQNIYQNTPIEPIANDFERAKVAAKADFEAEGIRFTAVQSKLYEMEALGSESLERQQTPLPQDFSLKTVPLSLDKDQQATHLRIRDLTLRFLNSEPPDWFKNLDDLGRARGRGRGSDRKLASVQLKLKNGTYSDNDRESNLGMALSYMEGWPPDEPKPQRGSLLQLFTISDESLLPQNGEFSPAMQTRLAAFLAESDWDPSGFLVSIGEGTYTQKRFVEKVLLNSGFQKTLGKQTVELYRVLPKLWVSPQKGDQKRLDRLPDLVRRLSGGLITNSTLNQEVKTGILELLDSVDMKSLEADLKEGSVVQFCLELLQSSVDDRDFHEELLAATQSLRKEAQQHTNVRARDLLQSPFPEVKKIHDFLQEAGTLEMITPLQSETEAESARLLKQSSLTIAEQGLIFGDGAPQALMPPVEERLSALTMSAAGEQQNHLQDHLFRHFDYSSGLVDDSLREQRFRPTAEILSGQDSASLIAEFEDSKNLLKDKLQNELQSVFPKTTFDSNSSEDLSKLKELPLGRETKAKLAGVEANISFLAAAESRPLVSRLAVLGHFKESREQAAAAMDKEGFQSLLTATEEAIQRSRTLQELIRKPEQAVSPDVSAFLVEGFLATHADEQDTSVFLQTLKRSLEVSQVKGPGGMLFPTAGATFEPTLRAKLSETVFQHLGQLDSKEVPRFFHPSLLKVLNPDAAASLLLKFPVKDLGTKNLARHIKRIDNQYGLSKKHPEVFRRYRAGFSETYKLQVSNLSQVFESTSDTPGRKESLSAIMGLSGLVSLSREKQPKEQLATIDYVMGRGESLPKYLANAAKQPSLDETVLGLKALRSRMAKADLKTRTLVANSFLAGPSGLLETKQQRTVVIDHFLGSLESKHQDLARKVAEALLRSQGESDTLVVANLLAHESDSSGKINLAALLNQLFDSFGVPGTKMKQYLAFTSEFEEFREAFQSSQDAADPIDHYDALKLIEKRFGSGWPAQYEVEKILGSGSINVALRYRDKETNQKRVVALARGDIEARTEQDFKRFRAFLDELITTPEDQEKFGYVLGLVKLVEQSVALEFDKDAALAVQKQAFQTYQHEVKGWNVKSIDAFEAQNSGLFMQEAKGVGARKLRQEDPGLYNEAMGALVKTEFGILRGETAEGNHKPLELFANPDIHDGQVLIDRENRAVTILDFGQATPITNEEREGGLDLLTVIANADSPKKAARRMNRRYFGDEEVLKPEDLESILQREDRMDRFVHLLSAISLASGDVPVSSVHWVFGINRQIALSETIGEPIEKGVKRVVRNHKLGLPLSWFNRFN